ncbi:hypothetical protein CYY_002754 [Polysphondylium violaceum]|uniref:BUB1 N-terminal domain-containing protein n=1 Tax=Polysphondylium violaceum TaxID=133409 RepID=A0A8J4PY03_9MYCE|nr:hypothetical protein CYY_002754 [Polysphondylium violaceum]
MSSSTTSLSDWENVKENILPLKTGRDPTKLATFARTSVGGLSNEDLEKEKEKYETLIKEYTGDDPMDLWLKYVKWVQQSYPGGNMKTELIKILERCTKLFYSYEKYKNDHRYLRIWITYADMCRDPVEIFAFLENRGIGSSLSLLYEAKAIVFENKGNYQAADEAFKLGIQRKASPLERLQQKHLDFERRLIARIKHQEQQQDGSVSGSMVGDENSTPSTRRAVLGTISGAVVSDRKSSVTKGAPIGGSDKKRKGPEKKSNSEFQIFSDETGGNSSNIETNSKFLGASRKASSSTSGNGGSQIRWEELEPELTKHKENTQIPAKWSETKITQKKQKSGSGTNSSFQVYCDESIETGNGDSRPASPDKLKLSNASKLSQLEQIQNNPLASFPKTLSVSSLSTKPSSSKSSSSRGNEKIGYKKELFINNEQELCFEEYRATLYMKKQNELDQLLLIQKKQQEEAELELKLKQEKEKQELLLKQQQEAELKLKQQQEREQQQNNTTKRNYDSGMTMTIHTKEAFNDVMEMFGGPLGFEDEKNSSSPDPFSRKQPQQQQQQEQEEPSIFSKPISNNIPFNDESELDNQENIDPAHLPRQKITNRDILKQYHQGPEQEQEEEEQYERERIKTMERIDRVVQKEVAAAKIAGNSNFVIFEDPTISSKPTTQTENDVNALRTSTKSTFSIFSDPEPVVQEKKPSSFSIFSDPEPVVQEKKQPSSFTIFSDEPITQEKKQPSSFTIFSDPEPQQQNQQSLSSFSISTISNITSSRFVDVEDQMDTTSDKITNRSIGNITGNLTQNIDPTGVIFCNTIPLDECGDGFNPYDADYQFTLEQTVSPVVQSIDTFYNCSDDVAPISTFLENVEPGNEFDVADDQITVALVDGILSVQSCIGRSNTSQSSTFKAECTSGSYEDKQLVVKIQGNTIWEFYICHQIQSRLNAAGQEKACPKFNQFHSLSYYADKSILLMDYLDQGNLVDVVESNMMDESLAMFYTIDLLKSLESLHSHAKIIHGSITPQSLFFIYGSVVNWPDWSPNCEGAWDTKGFIFTDYSKSIDISLLKSDIKFSCALDQLAPGTSPIWFESRKNSLWSYDIDYLGLAQVVYYILCNGKASPSSPISISKDESGQLYFTDFQSLVDDKIYTQSNALWSNLLSSLLNFNNSVNEQQPTTGSILLTHRTAFEQYLSTDDRAKYIKNNLRKQNLKVFETISKK